MEKVYKSTKKLDIRCNKKYLLNEDILMEHAASSMLYFIEKKFKKKSKVLIVSGPGNNGADGIALARLLQNKYLVKLYIPNGTNTTIGNIQLKRTKSTKVQIVNKITKADIVVDCFFGSGLNRKLDNFSYNLIKKINYLKKSYVLSCDIPSGINYLGQVHSIAIKADTTITMGAFKRSLFTDIAKNYTGKIIVANLGVQKELFQMKTKYFLLNKKDLKLPVRKQISSHKGNFGHFCVVVGEKEGAGLLCAKAGISFGAGLTTVICDKEIQVNNCIMKAKSLPANTTSIAIGMGLGKSFDKNLLNNDIPKVIDADLFYNIIILDIIKQDNIILTPHPKEFVSLLKITNIADISVKVLQNNRFKYIRKFSKKYPKITLLLKGANVLITYNKKIYINTFGTSVLSKGGSGDVLSGLIGSLLAQNYTCINAAIQGSLAHTLSALKYKNNNYSLTADDLIEQIKILN